MEEDHCVPQRFIFPVRSWFGGRWGWGFGDACAEADVIADAFEVGIEEREGGWQARAGEGRVGAAAEQGAEVEDDFIDESLGEQGGGEDTAGFDQGGEDPLLAGQAA